MSPLVIHPVQGDMRFDVTGSPLLEGGRINCCFPEATGDAARPVWFGNRPTLSLRWEAGEAGLWRLHGSEQGEADFMLELMPGEQTLDCVMELTNRSTRRWAQGFAFHCVDPLWAAPFRDHEGVRHWCGHEGRMKCLTQLPRVFGPRPAIQLYSVQGAPPGEAIPFVAGFKATPPGLVLEGWLAIGSIDGRSTLAIHSSPALFLFQNFEYSCIHCGPSFGSLEPGQSATARTRMDLVPLTPQEWYGRLESCPPAEYA